MKILVVGTGVIGTIYGWSLSESGSEVYHYVRKGKKDLFKDGISINMLDERKGHKKESIVSYKLACIEDVAADDFDLVMVPVNIYQVSEVLKELAPKLSRPQFLIMSSNWNGTADIDKAIAPDRYLLGYADGGGTFKDDGMIANLGPNIHLGELDGKMSPRLETLIALFKKADMEPEVAENILHWLWLHNATSAAIWAGFSKHRDIKAFMKDRVLMKESFDATKECLNICRKNGVPVEKYGDLSYFKYPTWLIILIFKAMFKFNKSMQVYTAHAASDASMKEMRQNFMDIYDTGKQLNVPMPCMDKLYGIIVKG